MKQKLLEYIQVWENRCYNEGIPEEVPIRLEVLNKVPSYKQICKAILKNDNHLELLGFQKPVCQSYHILKRIELTERGVIKPSNQLTLL
jgi:predicted phosphoadenosine phosphosulfate sulfurtransferase